MTNSTMRSPISTGSSNIFNALLRLAEIDSGVRRAGFRRVELAGVTTELMELYEPLAEEKHVALTVDAPEGIAVRGDPDLLAQAIGNLVDNAIKYTPCEREGGIAHCIRCEGPGGSCGHRHRAGNRRS